MRKLILRFYLTVRKPRNFLKIACVFIASSLSLHWLHGYDPEFGATNLILSIDATIASAIMLMIQEEGAALQEEMLKKLVEMGRHQDETLRGVLLLAEASRDMLVDHEKFLRALREGDVRILEALSEGDRDGMD